MQFPPPTPSNLDHGAVVTSSHVNQLFRLPLRISERRVLLIIADLAVVNGALIAALQIRSDHAAAPAIVNDHLLWFLVLSAIWLGMAHAFDAYEPRVASRPGAGIPAVAKAALFTAVLYFVIPYVTPPLPASRMAMVSLPFFMLAGLACERGLYALVLPHPGFQHRTLIIGAGWAGHTVAEALLECGGSTHKVLGFVDDDPSKIGTTLEFPIIVPNDGSAPMSVSLGVLGRRNELKALIASQRVSMLVLAITHPVDADLLQILIACVEQGVAVVPMIVAYEELTGRVPVQHVGGHWYVSLPIAGGIGSNAVKRIMDIVLATLGLIGLGILLPVIAMAIYLDSPGPVFYAQERVGRGGQIFRAYKFRSMVRDAEPNGAIWAQVHDPRVTRVGRFLRATHIDELPQFLNVLRGEMSTVGPRPERPEFAAGLAEDIPLYRLRHIVKPGMGGWGLIMQGYAGSQDDALVRLQYDLYYIKHQSLWLDLLILVKTLGHAITLRGRW